MSSLGHRRLGPLGPRGQRLVAVALGALALGACSNNPYPTEDDQVPVIYSAFSEPPKTLDPAVGYSTVDHSVSAKVYDTLLDYHYLKRPYELVAGMADAVPAPEPASDGRVRYHFHLREDLRFHPDDCFAKSRTPEWTQRYLIEPRVRRVLAEDVAFELKRIADPEVVSPVGEPFAHVAGLTEWANRLVGLRKSDPAFKALPIRVQYERAGQVPGLETPTERDLIVTLATPYPQILYWFAMPFTAPVPSEAVDYYDGHDGRPALAEHPVGSGPFILTNYQKRSRIVLERNSAWYGRLHPEWAAPAATFPDPQSVPGLSEEERARFAPLAGQALPLVLRVEFRREEESIPAFGKFLQGYYDLSSIARESFNKVIHEGGLSEDMRKRGVRLEKSVVPAVYYIGFNMADAEVGQGERARLLRQALSLAVDSQEYARVFLNGRGVPAHSPIPPGIFGYDAAYKNPFRVLNLERAKELLVQAGYPGGIDPKTGQPLELTFDVPDTAPEARVRFLFWTNQWRRLGVNVVLSATNYNQFQQKVRNGSYQIFQWGWVADYPDPENFLFLLTSGMAQNVSGGPNTANFKNADFDAIFERMKTMENGPERAHLIAELRAILERERPWIELFHPEEYALLHGWLHGVKPMGLSVSTTKYFSLQPGPRSEKRALWNAPILWPAWLLLVAGILSLIPLIVTYRRERR